MDGQISFTFEQRQPIKGYPELHWTGKRAYETEQFYPAQLKEVYGNPKDGWMIIYRLWGIYFRILWEK